MFKSFWNKFISKPIMNLCYKDPEAIKSVMIELSNCTIRLDHSKCTKEEFLVYVGMASAKDTITRATIAYLIIENVLYTRMISKYREILNETWKLSEDKSAEVCNFVSDRVKSMELPVVGMFGTPADDIYALVEKYAHL